MNFLSPEHVTWPPNYVIKKNRRSKSVRLKTSSQHGLEITVPARFNAREIPSILEKYKTWIIEQLTETRKKIIASTTLPQHILLHADNENFAIYYESCAQPLSLIERPNRELVVIGKQDNLACRKILTQWVKEKARVSLSSHLKTQSDRLQMPYKKLCIRHQQTRWGSCTSHGSINLNFKLIFLPYPLLKHILIHELCHLRHLNHSPHFWKLVASHDPLWRTHTRELKSADQFIPAWLTFHSKTPSSFL